MKTDVVEALKAARDFLAQAHPYPNEAISKQIKKALEPYQNDTCPGAFIHDLKIKGGKLES